MFLKLLIRAANASRIILDKSKIALSSFSCCRLDSVELEAGRRVNRVGTWLPLLAKGRYFSGKATDAR